ncbi:unnamed protein product [Sphenostylis stenocarpa]|uniref:Uncharacterized protein n=1 Tax=Sphenostylis stenocarpa TaxID=92480 RepID=A0AA86VUS3_9FABA|nr:unnamed protein product [Sphenostylis stenocarpa]
MDVMVGPTFTIDVPSSPPPPYASSAVDRPYGLFSGDSSESSSSIGTPDESDEENDVVSSKRNQNDAEEEVHNTLKSFASLDSLEDSLPIKRGLSNHFMGKSKSFTDLSQVNTVKELQKQENPFNKRRRVQIASKWSRRSSFYTWSNPKSMPLLPLIEDEDFYEENPKKVSPSSSSSSSSEEKKHEDQVLKTQQREPKSYVDHMKVRFGNFKSRSLSDLKEHCEEEDDEEEDNDD